MDKNKIKKDMMALWKSTFHDEDSYINMVFDAYFDPGLCSWRYEGEKLVAALLGVPYSFKNREETFHAIYLCGLATHPDFRGRGIMSELMREIERKTKDSGFSFSFLIPADEGLFRFYEDRGYSSAMRNIIGRYTPGHDFFREFSTWASRHDSDIRLSLLREFSDLKAWRVVGLDSFEKYDNGYSNIEVYLETADNPSSITDITDLQISEGENCGKTTDFVPTSYHPCESDEKVVLEKYSGCDTLKNDKISTSEINISDAHEFNESNNKNKIKLIEEFKVAHTKEISKKYISENNVIRGENIDSDYTEIPFYNIYSYVEEKEKNGKDFTLSHSALDLELVFKDLLNSNGGVILVTDKGKIVGVSFIVIDDEKVCVRRLYANDTCVRLRILNAVSLRWPSLPIEVINFPNEVQDSTLADVFYSGAMPEAPIVPTVAYAERPVSRLDTARNYGMVHILDFSHFLKFLANSSVDTKFSILVKNENTEIIDCFKAEGGVLSHTVISEEKFHDNAKGNYENQPVLTSHQLQSMILRKSEGEDAVDIAFGISAIHLNMALLLD